MAIELRFDLDGLHIEGPHGLYVNFEPDAQITPEDIRLELEVHVFGEVKSELERLLGKSSYQTEDEDAFEVSFEGSSVKFVGMSPVFCWPTIQVDLKVNGETHAVEYDWEEGKFLEDITQLEEKQPV